LTFEGERSVKVIFVEDVPDVAMAGETKEVADGYGRNYLLPKKLAVLANSAASNVLEAQMKMVLVKRAHAAAEMAEIASTIDGAEITIKAKVGESGRLYGSITPADISEELNRSTGQIVDKRKVVLDEPIRHLGNYDVAVAFSHDITASIKVFVEAEKTEEKEEKRERKPRTRKDIMAEKTDGQAEAIVAVIEETETTRGGPVATPGEEGATKDTESEADDEKPARKTRTKESNRAEEAAPGEEIKDKE
jgi:large subunit ribosomal protein L9